MDASVTRLWLCKIHSAAIAFYKFTWNVCVKAGCVQVQKHSACPCRSAHLSMQSSTEHLHSPVSEPGCSAHSLSLMPVLLGAPKTGPQPHQADVTVAMFKRDQKRGWNCAHWLPRPALAWLIKSFLQQTQLLTAAALSLRSSALCWILHTLPRCCPRYSYH